MRLSLYMVTVHPTNGELISFQLIFSQLAEKNTAMVYTTDAILSVLMCAPRSVNSWDIMIVREGNSLFLDKREGGPLGACMTACRLQLLLSLQLAAIRREH